MLPGAHVRLHAAAVTVPAAVFMHIRVVLWRLRRVLALVDPSASEQRKHYQERGASDVPVQAALPEAQGAYS